MSFINLSSALWSPSVHIVFFVYRSLQPSILHCILQVPGPRPGEKPITNLDTLSIHTHTQTRSLYPLSPTVSGFLCRPQYTQTAWCFLSHTGFKGVILCVQICVCACRRGYLHPLQERNYNLTTGPPVELIKSVRRYCLNESAPINTVRLQWAELRGATGYYCSKHKLGR